MQNRYKLINTTDRRGLGYVLICIIAALAFNFVPAAPAQAAVFITSSPLLPSGQVSRSYYAALTATGDNPPYTWVLSSGAPPPGLTLAATGALTGTPSIAGTFNFNATVSNSASPPATQTQAFVITISQPPLTVTTTSLPSAKEGVNFNTVLAASGGTGPYTWAVSSGNLPSGVTLQSGGFITGTPAKGTLGTYTFTVTVTDSSATPLTGQGNLYLTVEKGGYAVTITIGSGLKSGTTRVLSGTTLVATLAGGGSTTLSLDLGSTPAISVDATVQNPSNTGIRYKAEESKITVSDLIPAVTFNYFAEYNIELKTDPATLGQQTGSGWYKEGYVLRNTAQSEIADPNNSGIVYRFASWKLPTGETVSNCDLALTVSAPGTCTATYDTYYKLTLTSPYGDTNVVNWYKAGGTAEWNIKGAQVGMPGFFGIFGGKLNAVNPTGSIVMDAPKTIMINWEPDYTLPFILIPLAILVLVFGSYGIYLLLHGPRTRPQFQGGAPPPQWVRPVPPPPPPQPTMPPPWYRPIPPPQPPQTTVVMIGGDNNKPKIGPPTTKEQLMEKFGELLEKYGDELKGGAPAQASLPKIGVSPGGQKPPSAELPSPRAEAPGDKDEESSLCNFKSKRLLRPVAARWKKVATKDTLLESGGKDTAGGIGGTLVVWSRDIYQEWEIVTCELPRGHEEPHDRSSIETVYSLLNNITEVKVYKPEDELTPPKPHYTDSMAQLDVESYQIVSSDKLPPATTT